MIGEQGHFQESKLFVIIPSLLRGLHRLQIALSFVGICSIASFFQENVGYYILELYNLQKDLTLIPVDLWG